MNEDLLIAEIAKRRNDKEFMLRIGRAIDAHKHILDRLSGRVEMPANGDTALPSHTCVAGVYKTVFCQPDGTPYPPTILNYGEDACTTCGSLRPERFLEMWGTPGYTVEMSTKRYKYYIRHENGWNGKFYTYHLVGETLTKFRELTNQA